MTLARSILVGCCLSICIAPPALARWQASPGLTTNLFFTDNLFLEAEDRQSDLAVRIAPGITAKRQGRRIQAQIAYSPGFLFYAGNSDLNDVHHILRADLDTELIERLFFLQVRARANQNLVDPSGRVRDRAAFDAISNPDASTQTASLAVTPDIRIPIVARHYAQIRIRPGLTYSFIADSADDTSNDGAGGEDTQVNITSGPFFSRTPWSIDYRSRLFDTDTEEGFDRFSTKVGYIFDNRFRADLTLGQDESNFDSRNDGNGFRWRITGTWTPTSRTSLALGVGRAFYGNDGILRFSHKHKHSRWTADYEVSLENARQEIIDRQVVPFTDPFGNPIDPLTGRRPELEVGTAALVDDVFLRDRLEFDWFWKRKRNSVKLELRYDRRDYQDLDLDTRDGRIRFRYTRRMTGRLSTRLQLDYWDHTENEDLQDFAQHRVRLGVDYQLGARTFAGLDLLRTDSDSDNPLDDYTENRIDLTLSYSWNRGL